MHRLLTWLERFKTPITVVLVIGLLTAVGAYTFHSTQLRSLMARAAESSDDEALKQLVSKQQAIMAQLASIKVDQPAGLPTTATAASTEQSNSSSQIDQSTSPIGSSNSSTKTTASSSATTTTGLVHLNSADESALETLPDIGPSKAQAILDYRTAHGAFKSIDELDNVKGIGAATIDKLRPHLTLD